MVDVKCQKQLAGVVFKIFIKMFRKLDRFSLNSHFFSFRDFHWYLIADLISYIPQFHEISFTIDMCQVNAWKAVSLQLLFRIF